MKIQLVPFRLNLIARLASQKISLDIWSLDKDKDVGPVQMQLIGKSLQGILPNYAMTAMDRTLCVKMCEEMRPLVGPLNCIEIHWSIDDTPLNEKVARPPLHMGIVVVKSA